MKSHLFNTIKIMVFVGFTILSTACFGQIDPLKKPDVVPLSPEAAGIGRYGDIPVSNYTGRPNISIPLHVVKSGKLSLPINLDYQATGIGVTQEASWVGLGWNLIAGGAINYVAVGGNDQTAAYSVSWENLKKALDFISKGTSHPEVGKEDDYIGWECFITPQPNAKITPEFISACESGKGEPDLYSANFLNYSFKFILNPKDNLPLFFGKKNKCKILPCPNNTFEIIGEDGIRYQFFLKEIGGGNRYFQSWYLTKIIDPDGHYITLDYVEGNLQMLPTLSEHLIEKGVANFNGTYRTIYPTAQIKNYYLTQIQTNSEIVLFNSGYNRPDLNSTNARRLNGIKVIDKITNTTKKQYRFEYDWFNNSLIGGNFLNDGDYANYDFSAENISKRLKLTGLKKINSKDTVKYAESYSFAYNEKVQLPYKTSFAMDYWGFYNGEENSSTILPDNAKHTLLPGFCPLMIQYNMYNEVPEHRWGYIGAFRGTSPDHITANMLKSITYPTGGRTEFEFEPHTFINSKYYSVDTEKNFAKNQNASVWDNNRVDSQKTYEFSLTNATKIHITGTINGYNLYTTAQIKDAYIMLVKYNSSVPYIFQFKIDPTQQGNSKSWDEYIDLEPGKYILMCSSNGLTGPIPSGSTIPTPVVYASITYINLNQDLLDSAQRMGGGVRVKQISNYDTNNKLLSTQNYSYSGGKLLVPIDNIVHNTSITDCDRNGYKTFYDTFRLSSDNFFGSSISYVGNTVGYDKVEIKNVSNDTTNGTEVSCFVNDPPTIFYNKPIFDQYATNGDITSQVYLNSVKDTIRMEKYDYQKTELYSEQLNAIVNDTYIGPIDACFQQNGGVPLNLCAYLGRYDIAVYPHKNFWSYLQKKVVTDYFNSGLNKVTSITEYTYNPANYCPSYIKELESTGTFKYTTFKYPSDYTTSPYSEMVNQNNILTPVVERTTTKGTSCESIKTNYYNPSGGIYVPETVQQTVGTITNTRLTNNSYDDKGNVTQFTGADGIPISLLWDDTKTYLMARVEGATYSQISTQNGQISTYNSKTLWTSLNNLVSKAMVTTYCYDPLIGITSETAPNGTTTYYIYDSFGRLSEVKNDDGKILKKYTYKYATN